MKVRLKSNWFSPDRQFFMAGVREVSESLRDSLPSSAEVLGEEPKPKPAPASKKKSEE